MIDRYICIILKYNNDDLIRDSNSNSLSVCLFQWTSPKGEVGIRCRNFASRPGLAFSNAPYQVQVLQMCNLSCPGIQTTNWS